MIFCAHTHIPRLLPLGDGRIVVNPGSVGLPAYSEDAPWRHRMESGSPHARYALLRKSHGRSSVELRAISYQWDAAASAARARGRDDWARPLQTGLALTA